MNSCYQISRLCHMFRKAHAAIHPDNPELGAWDAYDGSILDCLFAIGGRTSSTQTEPEPPNPPAGQDDEPPADAADDAPSADAAGSAKVAAHAVGCQTSTTAAAAATPIATQTDSIGIVTTADAAVEPMAARSPLRASTPPPPRRQRDSATETDPISDDDLEPSRCDLGASRRDLDAARHTASELGGPDGARGERQPQGGAGADKPQDQSDKPQDRSDQPDDRSDQPDDRSASKRRILAEDGRGGASARSSHSSESTGPSASATS